MIQPNSMFDPLLMGGVAKPYEQPTNDIQRMQQELEAKKQMLEHAKVQAMQQPATPMPQQSQCPVWDEINSIMDGMSEQEFSYVASNEEFQQSQADITSIMQAEYLRLMRPLVEQTQAGKDALDRHLTLVKRLKKTASKAVDDELALFTEYRKNYAHISFEEFMKMKKALP